METHDCPQNQMDCRHKNPLWQTRMTIIPETMGFLISCDMRLLPMGEFLHVAKIMHEAAVAYLKEEGIILETRLPGLKLVKS
ncbi:MAG: hypothetical protein C4567_04080 [Deltaproteobacteria bacterium]|nr:MAG: hypothetical protein C4567_04080 [Deltaproteobacteria bacterium]